MNIKHLLVTVCLSLLILGYLLIDKKNALNILTVLGLFSIRQIRWWYWREVVRLASTYEVKILLSSNIKFTSNILMCAFHKHKNSIINYSALNGVRTVELYVSSYEYEGW